jgi:hypothetical protein
MAIVNINTTYLPVNPDYLDVIAEEIEKQTTGKIFFFNTEGVVDDLEGRSVEIREIKGKGVFVLLENGREIRVDRIITLYGKIGAAYDEYDAYGSSCMDCLGGYDIDEL